MRPSSSSSTGNASSLNGCATTGTSARIRRSCARTRSSYPPPELVRAHLATAVDAVLSKGPTPGKRAIERFKDGDPAGFLPGSQDDLARYLRDRYFEPGKSSLRRGLAELIVKDCLDDDETGTRSRDHQKVRAGAHALERIEPGLLTDALSAVVTKREEGRGLSDDELLCFTANLGDMPLAWQALPDVVPRHGSTRCSRTPTCSSSSITASSPARSPPKRGMPSMPGSAELDDVQLAEVIGQDPESRRFGHAAIDALQQSQTNDDATRIMDTLVLPLARTMTDGPGPIRPRLPAGQSAGPDGGRDAATVHRVLRQDGADVRQLLSRTGSPRPMARRHGAASGPEHHFAYPELWARVHAPRSPQKLAFEVGLLELEHLRVLGDDPLLLLAESAVAPGAWISTVISSSVSGSSRCGRISSCRSLNAFPYRSPPIFSSP